MMSSAWNFVKRHKKKFIALGVVGGVGAAGYYYAKRLVRQGMEQVEEMGQLLSQQIAMQELSEQELKRVQRECSETIKDFIIPVRRQIQKLTDARPIAAKLKSIRSGKENGNGDTKAAEKLWEDLKVVILTRLISEAYAIVLLSLLKCQLHVMARAAFAEIVELKQQSGGAMDASAFADFESTSDAVC